VQESFEDIVSPSAEVNTGKAEEDGKRGREGNKTREMEIKGLIERKGSDTKR